MTADLHPVTFGPRFKSADIRKRLESEHYTAVWLENIIPPEDEPVIEYKFIMMVFPRDEPDPVLFLTSEINASAQSDRHKRVPGEDGGSHFLCMFDAEGHHNFGASNAWADPVLFHIEATIHIFERIDELLRPEGFDRKAAFSSRD